MRLSILVLSVLIGCSTPVQQPINEYTAADSILKKSQLNAVTLNETSTKSDTSISSKVDKTVKKIAKMEGEIKQLKQENNELKTKLDDANDDGEPFNIRTISNN